MQIYDESGDLRRETWGWFQRHVRRCETAKSIGISMQAEREGAPVPIGWRLDFVTQYWLPGNVVLF